MDLVCQKPPPALRDHHAGRGCRNDGSGAPRFRASNHFAQAASDQRSRRRPPGTGEKTASGAARWRHHRGQVAPGPHPPATSHTPHSESAHCPLKAVWAQSAHTLPYCLLPVGPSTRTVRYCYFRCPRVAHTVTVLNQEGLVAAVTVAAAPATAITATTALRQRQRRLSSLHALITYACVACPCC